MRKIKLFKRKPQLRKLPFDILPGESLSDAARRYIIDPSIPMSGIGNRIFSKEEALKHALVGTLLFGMRTRWRFEERKCRLKLWWYYFKKKLKIGDKHE